MERKTAHLSCQKPIIEGTKIYEFESEFWACQMFWACKGIFTSKKNIYCPLFWLVSENVCLSLRICMFESQKVCVWISENACLSLRQWWFEPQKPSLSLTKCVFESQKMHIWVSDNGGLSLRNLAWVSENACLQGCPWVVVSIGKIALLWYLRMLVKLWKKYHQLRICNAHLMQFSDKKSFH